MKIPIKFNQIIKINILILIITILITYLLNFKSISTGKIFIDNSEKFSKTVDLYIIFKIFINNLLASLLIIFSGIFIFTPIILFIININLYVMQFIVILNLKIPFKFVILLGFPHIIFEFISIIISTSIALYIPYSLLNYIYFKKYYYFSKENLVNILKVFLLSVNFLIIGAIIEGTMIYIVSRII